MRGHQTVGIRADECAARQALGRLHTAHHIDVTGVAHHGAAGIADVDAAHDVGGAVHTVLHGQAAGDAARRTRRRQRDACQINGVDARIEQGRGVRTLNLQVGDGSPVGRLAVHVAEEVFVPHVEVAEAVAVAVEAAHEGCVRASADALQLPVFEVQVVGQPDGEVDAQVVVVEGVRAFEVIAFRVCRLVGIGGIVAVVEDVAHLFGLGLFNPYGVELAVGQRPPVGVGLADYLSADNRLLVRLHQAVESRRSCGRCAVDQADELKKLLFVADDKLGVIVGCARIFAGRGDGILPPFIVLGGRDGLLGPLIGAFALSLGLLAPRQTLVCHDIKVAVAVAHAEGVADAGRHLQAVGKRRFGLAVGVSDNVAFGVE